MSTSVDNAKPDLSKGFVGVYHPISGWKAVMYLPDPDMDGELSPWQTGCGAYRNRELAVAEARSWAESEGLPFVE